MAHIPGFLHPEDETQPQGGLLGTTPAAPAAVPAPTQPQTEQNQPQGGFDLSGFKDPQNLALIAGGLQFASTGDISKALQAASLGIQVGTALQPKQQEALTPSEIAQLNRTFTPESIQKFEVSRNTSDLKPIDEPGTTKVTQGSVKNPDGTFQSVPVAQRDGQLWIRNPDTNQFDVPAPPGTAIDDARVVKQAEKTQKKTAAQEKKTAQTSSLQDELTRLGVTVGPGQQVSLKRLANIEAQIGVTKPSATSTQPFNIIKELAFQEWQSLQPGAKLLVDEIGGWNPKNPQKANLREKLENRANLVGVGILKAQLINSDSALAEVEASLTDILGIDEGGNLLSGDIPGIGIGGPLRPGFTLSAKGQRLKSANAKLRNIVLRDRSGAAVTVPEFDRLKEELAQGNFSTEREYLIALGQLRKQIEEHKGAVFATYRPKAVELYQRRTEGSVKPRKGISLATGAVPGRPAVPQQILSPNFDLGTLKLTTPGLNPILQKARRREPLTEAEKRVLRAFKTQTERSQ